MEHGQEHDVIVVGSGTCGAEIARQLAGQGARVLVLERGGDPPPAESLFGMMSMADEVKVGKGLSTLRVLAAGGSSAMYFGVVNQPPLDAFRALGVDLAPELETLRAELPIGHLPDEMLGEQSVRLRDAAVSLGLDWRKHEMLIDPAKIVDRGYTYGALWKAKSLLDEAESRGVQVDAPCAGPRRGERRRPGHGRALCPQDRLRQGTRSHRARRPGRDGRR